MDRDAETGKWSTMLCPNCDNSVKAKKIPSLSIAGGIDFGYYKRLGLEEPNLQEQLILSRTRLCHAVLKASSNNHGASKDFDSRSLARIHAIIFPHNAPEVATHLYNPNIFEENGLLDLEQLKNQLSIYFVTDKGSHDSLANAVFGSSRILARPWVIAQWLLVLKATNKSYEDLDLQNVTKDRVTAVLDKLRIHLEETAEILDAPEVLQFEEQLGSDVAQNQHTEEVDEVVDESGQQRQEGVSSMRYTYLTKQEKAYLAGDDKDFRLSVLKKVTNSDKWKTVPRNKDEPIVKLSEEDLSEMMDNLPNMVHNVSRRGADPLSDFGSGDAGFATCFPTIFTLGKAYGKSAGSIYLPQRLHLLQQFTNVAAQDRRFLGFLFDAMQRARVCQTVKGVVDRRPAALNGIAALLDDPKERDALQEAIKHPKREKSKKMLQKYLSYLRFVGGDIPYGAVEGNKLKHRMIGVVKRHSDENSFITVSPNNHGNARSVRHSHMERRIHD